MQWYTICWVSHSDSGNPSFGYTHVKAENARDAKRRFGTRSLVKTDYVTGVFLGIQAELMSTYGDEYTYVGEVGRPIE